MSTHATIRAPFRRQPEPSAAAAVPAVESRDAHKASRWGALALSLGALGVVYGDIGTSPLYTVQLVFATAPAHAAHPDPRATAPCR